MLSIPPVPLTNDFPFSGTKQCNGGRSRRISIPPLLSFPLDGGGQLIAPFVQCSESDKTLFASPHCSRFCPPSVRWMPPLPTPPLRRRRQWSIVRGTDADGGTDLTRSEAAATVVMPDGVGRPRSMKEKSATIFLLLLRSLLICCSRSLSLSLSTHCSCRGGRDDVDVSVHCPPARARARPRPPAPV